MEQEGVGVPRFRSYDGVELAYQVRGAGRPLVCLGGGPGEDIRALGDLGGLDRYRTLILLDARGGGASATPENRATCSYTEQRRDVDALRRHLELPRVDVLAHSAGALTAQHYAAMNRYRVGSLVLVAPAGRADREVDPAEIAEQRARRADEPWYPAARAAAERLAAGGPFGEREAERLAADFAPFRYGRWNPAAWAHARGEYAPAPDWLREAFYAGVPDAGEAAERLAFLGAARLRVLVVAGAEDCVAGTRPARLAAECHHMSRFELLPGAGHYPWLEAPDRFRTAVAEFLHMSPFDAD
ncbi:alpha/beta fold hydrolase [Streptomyces litchfieldiae]|uniref:Alpha/beta hydrolase n=1 Tax=Streptomyces litchfieldiae TaxID=3075543 RepID=A0ABU2MTZ0_9ACTN|nr:alpha/beta hydrolase [Streptomyces sp. DSM 44938]MDT0345111.1 alpha/beta hydrolase [Streptomyces sp. DSM 44938]